MAESFADRVKQLQLPLDKSIVIGSGLLDQLGIRSADDIDVVVTPEVFSDLAENPAWHYDTKDNGRERYVREDIGGAEVWTHWNLGDRRLEYANLAEQSVVYDDVRFVSLALLRQWKEWAGREKDARDVALIDQYSEENK
ncbi:MAG: hypothetical protein Q4A34_03280 [Candidatus Saccharibacteria bacterium]|nr:hypothetical protein [Candidatus Saccharibacteria bacterium]